MLNKLVDALGHHESTKKGEIIKGRAVLMKKNVLDFNDFNASIVDGFDELLGKKISFQLVSAVNPDPGNEGKGKLGEPSYLEKWLEKSSGLTPGDLSFEVSFDWDEEIALPGALVVRNEHHIEFYLKTVTLDDVPNQHGTIHFVCNSWVYPTYRYRRDRLFFTNQTYLPYQTPVALRKYREEELETLRGNGEEDLEEWDRIYDYAYYNDLADPDKGPQLARPVLGGSTDFPYPRRISCHYAGREDEPASVTVWLLYPDFPTPCEIGHSLGVIVVVCQKEDIDPPNIVKCVVHDLIELDPKTESRLPVERSIQVYAPRDERFGHLMMSDFLGYILKSLSQDFMAGLFDIFNHEFNSFQDELHLYEGGIKIPDYFDKLWQNLPFELLKAFLQNDGGPLLKFPMPQVIKEDKSAWRSDEEFAREMLAGMHPVIIRRLEEFPPKSKLDPNTYGNQNSTITNTHIEKNLDGLSVEEAIKNNKLFILDYHDALMPYLRKINSTPSKVYGTRTVLFLKEDGTLKPLAIELSLPHQDGDQFGAISKVFTPVHDGVEGSIWQLAKAYVAVNDQGYHQLYSHWTQTHVMVEPFVIATNRQLSVVHPIYKLLQPHFKNTMYINAVGRQSLLNAEGILETTLFHGKYSMEWTSWLYRDWVFTDQALPRDLLKRGMALENSQSPFGYKLLIEDYPYAVDGLEIWSAIETWVKDYCSFYYESDHMITRDIELQSWWKEVREKGHGDKKDEKWWPEMKTFDELTQTCTTIIWMASALHAALNFGQYSYAGYHPNRPTASRQFLPELGTPEYQELVTNPDKVFLRTISSHLQTLMGISTIELLSRHASDEAYLGQRDTAEWTSDVVPLEAFERFGKKLMEIEYKITERNTNEKLKNRVGPVKVPYTLLYPTSKAGLTGRGIPNSISA